MKNYYTVCYVSKTSEDLSEERLEELFQFSSTRNTTRNITGILLHEMGSFFQVLEGDEESITALYNIIKKDPRHQDVYLVFNRKTIHPVFKAYNSKFNVVKTHDDLRAIKTYLDKNRFHSTTNKISRLLNPFLMMRE